MGRRVWAAGASLALALAITACAGQRQPIRRSAQSAPAEATDTGVPPGLRSAFSRYGLSPSAAPRALDMPGVHAWLAANARGACLAFVLSPAGSGLPPTSEAGCASWERIRTGRTMSYFAWPDHEACAVGIAPPATHSVTLRVGPSGRQVRVGFHDGAWGVCGTFTWSLAPVGVVFAGAGRSTELRLAG